MTDKEQIEEMAKTIRNKLVEQGEIGYHCSLSCKKCRQIFHYCKEYDYAEILYNAGYRKESETAKKILNKVKERSVWFIENTVQKDHFNEQMQELAKDK